MISQVIKYKDFDDNDQVATAWFHLSMKKLIKYNASIDGGMAKVLTDLVESDDREKIIERFTEIVGMAYGQRVDGDASAFRQSDEITDAFLDSPVFDALLVELLTNENTATALIAGIFPKEAMEKVQAAQAANAAMSPNPAQQAEGTMTEVRARELSGLANPYRSIDDLTLLPWAFRDPTAKEQTAMTHEQLLDCMKRRSSGWEPKPA